MKLWCEHTWTCGHLVLAFYHAELGIDLPDYAVGQFAAVPPLLRAAWKARALEHAIADGWRKVDMPFFGAVAVFGEHREYDGHVGVVVEPLRMLHVTEDRDTRLDRFDGPCWAPTLRGFYRWQGTN